MSHAYISFFIPGTPVGKGRARVTTRGGFARAYTPKKTVAYEGHIKACYLEQCGGTKLHGPLTMALAIGMPVPASWSKKKRAEAVGRPHTSKPDLSNILKCVEDALNGVAYADDAAIFGVFMEKHYSEEPGITVTIREDLDA